MDIEDLARGLVAGVLTDTIARRGKALLVGALVAGVVLLIVGFTADGWLRWLLVFAAVVAFVSTAVIALLRTLALIAVRQIGEPQEFGRHRDVVTSAIERAALPTGPIAAMRFAWRLRKGADHEVARLKDVVSDLREDLDQSQ